jgi:hypothetical protein
LARRIGRDFHRQPTHSGNLSRWRVENRLTTGLYEAIARSGQTNALKPVIAFPAIRVFMSRVPSCEWIASASATKRPIRLSSGIPLPQMERANPMGG